MALNNRSLRIIVSVLAIPLLLALTYLGGLFFLFFAILIGVVGVYELGEMVKNKGIHLPVNLLYLLTILLIGNFYRPFIDFHLLIILTGLLLLTTELFRNNGSAILNLGTSFLALFYIGLFTGSLVGVREFYNYNDLTYSQGAWLVIAIMATIWICDSAAYFLGTAFGKHKMFPRVSPNKSWEGAAAGFVFSLITMLVAQNFFLEFLTVLDSILIGLMVGIFGQVGDLVESLIKRDANVKDSSSIIPGHGGIFDRFDSLLFVSPLVFLYLNYIN